MRIQESGENYLETILILKNRNGYVRSIDVANELGFSKASVSRAMSILKEAGLLVMEQNGNLVLTEAGYGRASAVYERHTLIATFLEETLGVDHETAVQDSCRIEHIISEESFRRIKKYVKVSGEGTMNYQTIRCPHCGKELQVPDDAEKIVCMFCAQPIGLKPNAAEPPAPTGEAALLFPQEAFAHRIRVNQLNAKRYPGMFEDYRALIRPALDTFFREAEADPDSASEAFSEALVAGFSEQERLRSNPPDYYGCRFTIVALLIPAILERGDSAGDRLADRFLEKWNARFPKHPLGKATYSAIADGFRKKLCFVTTAVCRELGKGDACAELQEFRRFRDGWLSASPHGAEKIGEYYLFAPLIVRAVETSADAGREYRRIWRDHLLPCLSLLRGGDSAACAQRYEAMMDELERNWLAKSSRS